ncbi:unnamed protein product [Vitrella brassicaformis CCMP3155]|uniref:Uncharacterized protein n=1 Tax=Vitrella brassicaformis (strain CCMP3155) TaxID=1169540 RepID=A0A0G4GJ32_VITBC|nr:unnamed protein product [Vitrella brassicaformis CCMP3155]|eukprot:CEM29849.1 unnamed protein product [Vitrella brassicaformis CCMP3155]
MLEAPVPIDFASGPYLRLDDLSQVNESIATRPRLAGHSPVYATPELINAITDCEEAGVREDYPIGVSRRSIVMVKSNETSIDHKEAPSDHRRHWLVQLPRYPSSLFELRWLLSEQRVYPSAESQEHMRQASDLRRAAAEEKDDALSSLWARLKGSPSVARIKEWLAILPDDDYDGLSSQLRGNIKQFEGWRRRLVNSVFAFARKKVDLPLLSEVPGMKEHLDRALREWQKNTMESVKSVAEKAMKTTDSSEEALASLTHSLQHWERLFLPPSLADNSLDEVLLSIDRMRRAANIRLSHVLAETFVIWRRQGLFGKKTRQPADDAKEQLIGLVVTLPDISLPHMKDLPALTTAVSSKLQQDTSERTAGIYKVLEGILREGDMPAAVKTAIMESISGILAHSEKDQQHALAIPAHLGLHQLQGFLSYKVDEWSAMLETEISRSMDEWQKMVLQLTEKHLLWAKNVVRDTFGWIEVHQATASPADQPMVLAYALQTGDGALFGEWRLTVSGDYRTTTARIVPMFGSNSIVDTIMTDTFAQWAFANTDTLVQLMKAMAQTMGSHVSVAASLLSKYDSVYREVKGHLMDVLGDLQEGSETISEAFETPAFSYRPPLWLRASILASFATVAVIVFVFIFLWNQRRS